MMCFFFIIRCVLHDMYFSSLSDLSLIAPQVVEIFHIPCNSEGIIWLKTDKNGFSCFQCEHFCHIWAAHFSLFFFFFFCDVIFLLKWNLFFCIMEKKLPFKIASSKIGYLVSIHRGKGRNLHFRFWASFLSQT